jgi:hypothetical protein
MGEIVVSCKEYASDTAWSSPPLKVFSGQPPDGDPEVAPQTKEVVKPETRTDVDTILKAGLLDTCERETVTHILTEGAAPDIDVVVSPGHFNGWRDGRVAQDGTISQKRDLPEDSVVFACRVFDPHLPPLDGYLRLPAEVVHRRQQDDARVATMVAGTQQRPPAPPLCAKAPPKRKQQSPKKFEEQNAETDVPVADGNGHALLKPGDMVACWLGDLADNDINVAFPYGIARVNHVGARGPEYHDGVEEEEEDEIQLVVQWFGNSRGQIHGYSASSKFKPGWEDLGDLKQPLVFSDTEPKKGGHFHITGAVVPYETKVPISTVAQHGFVLNDGLLSRALQKILANLQLPRPASEPLSTPEPHQAQPKKRTRTASGGPS